MADGELFTTFVDGSPSLSLPAVATDAIPVVRGAVTYKVAGDAYVQTVVGQITLNGNEGLTGPGAMKRWP